MDDQIRRRLIIRIVEDAVCNQDPRLRDKQFRMNMSEQEKRNLVDRMLEIAEHLNQGMTFM